LLRAFGSCLTLSSVFSSFSWGTFSKL
jgi:hypothetical protein